MHILINGVKSSSPSIPRDLVKCCDCGHPSSTWFRSVKRKYDEFETTSRFSVPELDLDSNAKVQIENECALTGDGGHNDIGGSVFKREQTIQALTFEAQAYKHRMLSYGLTEEEVEGDSSNSFLPKETGSEFIGDSPRFDNSFKKMEFVSETDKISSSRRMDNASEIEDDMSDRVIQLIQSILGCHMREPPSLNLDLEIVMIMDTVKGMHLICLMFVIPISRSSTRGFRPLRLIGNNETSIISMRTENVQLVLLKEIAHICARKCHLKDK
ncbi:hypothetical protein F3Y22_tig00110213pilonHSYRG00013 [Hibiscus syriacus]|uniref:Uncharacterized protein n=1 Tax=Hibiscus syriacus TaxID=106335 RepID=A0A6A3BEE9_HIBSY|nr:hypothetical protein F3Y22_tig00110213pilonHSYRG00013 [Hibiscus syriacus]